MKLNCVVLGFAAGVIATPALFDQRAAQCADGCFSQVKANQLLGPSSKAGCKELFQQTVSPCTATVTARFDYQSAARSFSPCGPSITTRTILATLTTVTTTTTGITVLAKRTLAARACAPVTTSTTIVPAYFPSCRAIAAYSSACSCLGAPRSIITKPTPTVTINSVGCTSTTTIYTTTTVATVYSPTVTATSTSTVPYCAAAITATQSSNGLTKPYLLKYHGWGHITNPDDSRYNSDPNHPPDIEYLGDSDNDCAMIKKCANMAFSNTDVYYMFDLHYKDNEWICVQYYQGTGDASNFDQDEPLARRVYGYQVGFN